MLFELMRVHPLLGWLCLLLGVSCTGRTPKSDLPPPDISRVSVFYPVDRFVRGRGLEGAAPDGAVAVVIRALPEETFTTVPVDNNRGFLFSLRAKGGQTLEVASAADMTGRELSDSAFIQIPPLRELPFGIHRCCNGATNGMRCVNETRFEDGECPADTQIVERSCTDDLDCRVEAGEYVIIDPEQYTITPPGRDGLISISGVTEPNALVKITNRRLNGTNLKAPSTPFAQVTDDQGRFAVDDLFAAGDDELVFQTILLNGIRSAEVARLVPDAELEGIDVIGVYAVSDLGNSPPNPPTDPKGDNQGEILVVLAPFGIDQRGMCPNATPDKWDEICFTGGLTHEMVNSITLQTAIGENMNPVATMTSTYTDFNNRIYEKTRSREGTRESLRGDPLDIILAVDLSDIARTTNSVDILVESAAEFVRTSRTRDRIGVVFYGLTADAFGRTTHRVLLDGTQPQVLPTGVYDAEEGQLLALSNQIREQARALQSRQSVARPLSGGVSEAARMLREQRSKSGRIVVLATAFEQGTDEEIFDAGDNTLDLTHGNLVTGQAGFTVDIVGVGIQDFDAIGVPGATVFENITQLGIAPQGSKVATDLSQLPVDLQDLRTDIYGGIGLLYSITVPDNVSKIERVTMSISVTVGGVTKEKQYTGRLRIPRAQ